MDLTRAYRITLTRTDKKPLVQYIEAEDMDKAAALARRTFEAGFYKFLAGFEGQKACDKTKLHGKLRFGFEGGWNTLDCEGITIFEAMDKAALCFGAKQTITEIMSPTEG